MKREWLELAVAASAGVAAEPPTAATSPAVASATFDCGVIAAVATTVVSAIAASVAASIAASLAATPAAFASGFPGRTPGEDYTVKEAHAPSTPSTLRLQEIHYIAPKARQMSLKWENFAEPVFVNLLSFKEPRN